MAGWEFVVLVAEKGAFEGNTERLVRKESFLFVEKVGF